MIDETEIRTIVERVLNRVKQESSGVGSLPTGSATTETVGFGDGIFEDLESAVNAARNSYERLREEGKEKRKIYVEAIRVAFRNEAERLAEFAVQETQMGNFQDKIAKNLLCANKSPGVEDLKPTLFTGDNGVTYDDWVPYGVIGSLTPCTNPTSTIVNHAIIMIAGGNSVVFCPHPASIECTLESIRVCNQAVRNSGGPGNLLTAVAKPTLRVAKELMMHPGIDLLVVTGGAAVVRAGMESGKKAICAGPGNPPVVVDETADLDKAARNIVDGAAFDNNMPCICDKELYPVAQIADDLIARMKQYGAYEISGSQVEQLEKVILTEDGHPNRDYTGKDASVILKAIGVTPPSGTKLIIAETSQNHLFVQEELLMPVLPIVRVSDFEEAVQRAIEAEHGFGHTAIIHSNDVDRITRFARAIRVSLFVSNGMCGNVLGADGEGYAAMTIAGTTGEGVTSPRSFCKPRRLTFKNHLSV